MDLDTLGGRPVEVVLLEDAGFGGARVRAPHRHDYHELVWVSAGSGEHRVDGEPVAVVPGTVTVIGRGQVHQFADASGLHGAVLRVGEELLRAGRLPAGRAVPVPAGERAGLEALLRELHAEAARPLDRWRDEVCAALAGAVLARVGRWWAATRAERDEPGDAAVRLAQRFEALLERDFARHHDARHYADALGVPQAALSRALAARTGRTTKALVLDRVLLEAARLLRFSDLAVGEVAWRVGFRDPLHFSRAFKRRFGVAPTAYREAGRRSSA